MRLAVLQLDGAVLDEVLVVDRAPNGLELHLHGAPAVRAALHAAGWPIHTVEPTAVEQLLREALDVAQLDLALEQAAQPFDAYCRTLALLPQPARSAEVAAARQRSLVAMAQSTAERLVLVGRPNAGKSTLFNRLLCRERVLTGPQPGLTRDPVAERVCLDGYPYELVDTAGDAGTASGVDAVAVAAGRALRGGAKLLLVVDASRGFAAVELALWADATLVVANKADLPGPTWPVHVPCHLRLAAEHSPALQVRAQIGAALRQARGLPPAGPVGGPAALTAADLQLLAAIPGT
jgi:small GTP-binding protein